MIKLNSIFFKMLRIKKSSKSIFTALMKDFHPERETCPCCGSAGNMKIHCYYGRSLTDFIDGRPVDNEVTVLRLVCNSCRHTSAVLPDIIIPYETHSLFFVMRVLAEYYLNIMTVEKLCERFSITVRRLYQWIRKFLDNKELWLGIVSDMEISEICFLKRLVTMPQFSLFLSQFNSKAGASFMQTHAGPPYY